MSVQALVTVFAVPLLIKMTHFVLLPVGRVAASRGGPGGAALSVFSFAFTLFTFALFPFATVTITSRGIVVDVGAIGTARTFTIFNPLVAFTFLSSVPDRINITLVFRHFVACLFSSS